MSRRAPKETPGRAVPPSRDEGSPLGAWVALALAALAALLLRWSWRKWPDVLVDFGRELYVPWRLAEGDVLYADVAWFNGPLSPNFNGLLFRLFGPGMMTLAVANLVLAAFLTFLIYRLLRASAGRVSATVGCIVFLTVFAFSQYVGIGNYNFVTPYSHEATHGLILSFSCLACLWRWYSRRENPWLVGAGLLLGAVFLTKPEVSLAAFLSASFGVLICARARELKGGGALELVTLWGAASVPVVGTLFWLSTGLPVDQAVAGLLAGWRGTLDKAVSDLAFYESGMGLDDVSGNLAALGLAGVGLVALIAVGLLYARAVGRRPGRGVWALPLGALAVGGGLWLGREHVNWLEALRPLPLVLVGVLVGSLRGVQRYRREPRVRARCLMQVTLALFALLLLAKMALHTRVYHYGFTLALPGTLVLVALLLDWLPALAERRGGSRPAFQGVVLGTLAVAILAHLDLSDRHYALKSTELGIGRDKLLTDRVRGEVLRETLSNLEVVVGQDETLVVLPEGVMINYLKRRPNPTPFINFMPPELLLFGERRILAALQEHPPHAVVLVHKDTSEYGLPLFGSDYGQQIMGWVRGGYRPARLFGQVPLRPDTVFGVQVLTAARPPR